LIFDFVLQGHAQVLGVHIDPDFGRLDGTADMAERRRPGIVGIKNHGRGIKGCRHVGPGTRRGEFEMDEVVIQCLDNQISVVGREFYPPDLRVERD
jgi:hypothetical protein